MEVTDIQKTKACHHPISTYIEAKRNLKRTTDDEKCQSNFSSGNNHSRAPVEKI